ncbi:hypothetical protein B0H15DRAFT_934996 [Mycena belliarum]|uniref:Uncharacterized protein n=1 Tax=Mycena belliarum TaxID=1033014 RepID=A0AAD6TT63_9AGAR|nr:hypothetical protein B0H15DRAFT_934996 [Mycena belliae]
MPAQGYYGISVARASYLTRGGLKCADARAAPGVSSGARSPRLSYATPHATCSLPPRAARPQARLSRAWPQPLRLSPASVPRRHRAASTLTATEIEFPRAGLYNGVERRTVNFTKFSSRRFAPTRLTGLGDLGRDAPMLYFAVPRAGLQVPQQFFFAALRAGSRPTRRHGISTARERPYQSRTGIIALGHLGRDAPTLYIAVPRAGLQVPQQFFFSVLRAGSRPTRRHDISTPRERPSHSRAGIIALGHLGRDAPTLYIAVPRAG